ncbi:MAG: DNA polymerase III subunit gamma/tau [Acidobacteriota bacterium]
MAYQVLARKWRPQDFSSLIGQEHVVTALRNGLTEDRVAQAYLFSGIRGVGKTTAARVFAKALNCERGGANGPCNECGSCLEINAGTSLDFIEVDAATYSKVEQVRELTETLRYGPARGRYKIVVLDEVHRLSRQAFDALLKIVEEPPEHLVFIFATTEIDAVPATILSRCQEYQFRRVPSAVLAGYLRTICDAESIETSDSALRLIARAGEGSVRDSVALLDQMATFGSGTIADEEANRLLGGLDTAIFKRLLAAMLDGNTEPILEVVGEIEVNGWDPHNVYGQFLGYVRDAMHLAMGGRIESIELPPEEAESLGELMRGRGYEPALQILQVLLDSEPTVRRSEFGGLALEICWLRAAELPKVVRIQDILSGTTQVDLPASGPSPQAAPSRSGPPPARELRNTRPDPPARSLRVPAPERAAPRERNIEPQDADRPEPPSANREPAPAPTQPPAPSIELSGEGRLRDLLDLLRTRRQSLAAHLKRARLRLEDGALAIHIPRGDRLLATALERGHNSQAIEELLREVYGSDIPWSVVESDDVPVPQPQTSRESAAPSVEGHRPEPPQGAAEPGFDPRDSGASEPVVPFDPPAAARGPRSSLPADVIEGVAGKPAVSSVLEIFGGKIQSVQDEPEEKAR